ncbi:unnamed protein product, partial [Prunus brigantina]
LTSVTISKTTTTNPALNFSHNSSEFHRVLGSDNNSSEFYDDDDNDEEDGGGWERGTAYGVSVDAVCPGKKAGDICRTAIHQLSPAHQEDGHLNILLWMPAGSVEGRKCTAFPAVRHVLVAAGAYWVEPETLLACVVDGNMITGATYEGHPELFRFFVKALGGNITGSDRRILFLRGVSFIFLHKYLALDEKVIGLVKQIVEARKPIASICHGQILAAAGVLQKCTAYPAVKLNVVLSGATWLEPDPIDRCFTDGNLVNGAAWLGHPEFIS